MLENIHDSVITKYMVDFENNKMMINSKNENNEELNLLFEDVFAYSFENQLRDKNNIIFDIEEKEGFEFIKENKQLLIEKKEYGWPVMYNDMQELENIIKENKYKYYVLFSSYGMYGWIVCKRYKIS